MEFLNLVWNQVLYVVDLFLHLDVHLTQLVTYLGPWTYGLLFLIIFAETGLVVTPFLPGDSLLFATGAIIALPDSGLNLYLMMTLLFVAAVLGDAVNYSIGRYFGPKIFSSQSGWLFNRNHLIKTQAFYEKYGGKTIIIARFIPIIRTFAPFVAGMGQMHYRRFAIFNVVGAFAWVFPFTIAGYVFGNLPFVKSSFHYVILAIIVLSVLPAVIEILRAKSNKDDSQPELSAGESVRTDSP
jgi:membrane-associated protein